MNADKKVYSSNSGSVQRLPGGNTVVGYGYDQSKPAFVEVNPDKSVAFRLDLLIMLLHTGQLNSLENHTFCT